MSVARIRTSVAAALPALAISFAIATGCGSEEDPAPPAPETHDAVRAPVVVIGLDGATLRIAGPMMNRGELPTLARLRARGVHGVLESMVPTLSPVIWTTIVTGVSPERHGVLNFTARLPGRPLSAPVTVESRRVPALWNVASDAGKRVGVVGWWASWPAERVRGFVVSDTVVKTRISDRGTQPAEIGDRLRELTKGNDPEAAIREITGMEPAIPCRPWAPPEPGEERPAVYSRDLELCTSVQSDLASIELARSLSAETPVDLLLVYLKGIDNISHTFWKYSRPDDAEWRVPIDPAVADRYRPILEGYYRWTDGLVARLLEGLGASTVFVVSDHGFGPAPDCGLDVFQYNLLLQDLGLLTVGPHGIEWSRSVAVHDSSPSEPAGAIFVNLRERSPEGIVPLGAFRTRLAEIVAKLRALRTDGGGPLFDSIEPDDSPPLGRTGPDVSLRPSPRLDPHGTVRVDGRTFPIERYLQPRDKSGAHLEGTPAALEGIVFAAGPGIAHRRAPVHASVYDIAPTLACLLDVSLAERPEREASRALLSGDRIEACRAWSPLETTPRVAGPRSATPAFEGDAILQDQLRALGYVQ